MSAFLSMLEEINQCREAGFVRAALTLALCVPDACRKVADPDMWYEAWCEKYGGGVLLEFAKGLYSVRNNVVHEMRPEGRLIFDFSDAATVKFPVQMNPVSLSFMFHTINAGALICDIIGAGHRFYDMASQDVKDVLDRIDDGVVYESVLSMDYINRITAEGLKVLGRGVKQNDNQ